MSAGLSFQSNWYECLFSLCLRRKSPPNSPQNPPPDLEAQPPLKNNPQTNPSLSNLQNPDPSSQTTHYRQKTSLEGLQKDLQETQLPRNPQQLTSKPNTIPPNNSSSSYPRRTSIFKESEPPAQAPANDISVKSFRQKQDVPVPEACRLQRKIAGQMEPQDLNPKIAAGSEHQRRTESLDNSAAAISRSQNLDVSRKSNQSLSRRLNSKGFNNPSANYCFAHALLQILYGLPKFREETKGLAGHKKSNEILNKLCELFETIEDESKAQAEIERTKEEFLERIKQRNQGIQIFQPNGGDSRVLFQVLAQNICEGQPFEQNPIFSLFSTGNLTKQVSCQDCPQEPKNFVESYLMVNAREDLYFSAKSSNNFFQADFEIRRCSLCKKRTRHSKKITMETLPKILALRIEDCPSSIPPTRKPWKSIEFYDNRGRKKNYKFFGGVYNTNRGFDGVHSVAYIQETVHGFVRHYNDFMVRNNVDWEEIHGYAKLLFYIEENAS